ncbi:hypothetical protein [Winogradskyella sp.]|uniref:hypothetical protein n=1 Tax=Winogradskyella sp. TaxID=1883156 RepID=UPI003AA82426
MKLKMKKILNIVLMVLPLVLSGQNLKCCKSVNQVESYLRGEWIENKVDSNTVYEFWFENGIGHLSEKEIAEYGDEVIELEIQPYVEVIKYEGGFKIKFIYPNESWTSELKYINSSKLVLIRDGEETEYYRYEK